MDSRKVLYFLELLNRETNGYTDKIAEIYKRALDENDDIEHLKMILNDYVAYQETGGALFKNGQELLENIYAMPSKALDILPQLKQAHESIDNEIRICDELMHSPFPFSETVPVIKKKDTLSYMKARKMIASTSVYLMVLYAGMNPIKNLTWDDNVGMQEMIYTVNTKFLPSLCEIHRPDYGWIIRRKKLGGKALFGGDGYYLSYENIRSIEVLCSTLNKEQIGTHAFLNVDAYEAEECEVPFCWGTGNIVSVSPDTAILLLQNDVVTKLRSPQTVELKRKMPTPMDCVRQLSDCKMFCITPDELLLAMNQWQVGHEIEKRKETHNCLFCGKHVDGNKLICPSHFTTELR